MPRLDRSSILPSLGRGASLCGLLVFALWVKQVGVGIAAADDPFRATRALGVSFSTVALLASAAAASTLLLVAPLALASRPRRLAWLLALDALVSILLFADLLHLRFYSEPLAVDSLEQVGMFAEIAGAAFALARPSDLLLGLDLLVAAVLFRRERERLAQLPEPSPARARRRGAGAAAAVALVAALPSISLLAAEPQLARTLRLFPGELVTVVGILPWHAYDIASVLAYRVHGDRVERPTPAGGGDPRRIGLRVASASPLFGHARGRNLILISAESLTALPLGLTFDGQRVTPHLDALTRESLVFTEFYEQTFLGTSSDGELLVLQSVFPAARGTAAFRFADHSYRALPHLLAERGYDSLSISGSGPEFWNRRAMHRAYGIRRALFSDDFPGAARRGPWVDDRALLKDGVPLLEALPEPFFAYLLTASNHSPFELAPERRRLRLDRLAGTKLERYLQSVHELDDVLGELVNALRANGLLDRSVLAIYGDHHADFGPPERAARALGQPYETLYDRFRLRRRVVFLVRLPAGEAAGERAELAGEIDVAPTLLSLLGVDTSTERMLGRDLTARAEALLAFRDGSAFDGGTLAVRRLGPAARSTCFDVATRTETPCAAHAGLSERAERLLARSDRLLETDALALRVLSGHALVVASGGALAVTVGERRWEVSPSLAGGYVDAVDDQGAELRFAGWAGDAVTGAPAETVVLIDGGSGAYAVPVQGGRPDVVAATRRATLSRSGFVLVAPAPAGGAAALRLFALFADGRAAELRWHPRAIRSDD